jgi:2'-5' RNA ligase
VREVALVPRLFVALDLPDDVKRSLEPLAKGLGDVRWSTPDQQHLTLRFLGEVNNGTMHDVVDALATVPALPFELRLKGLGHFPPRGEPQVLWVGVDRSEELKSLKRRIDRALAEVGMPPESRKFAPHVTIARIRAPLSPTRLGTYLMRHSLYCSAAFPISSFHLYSSWLRPDGAEHQLEASYELVPGEGEFD